MQEVSKEKPIIILNQVEIYALEDIINNIKLKKEKSILRKLKNAIYYPFRLKIKVRVD